MPATFDYEAFRILSLAATEANAESDSACYRNEMNWGPSGVKLSRTSKNRLFANSWDCGLAGWWWGSC